MRKNEMKYNQLEINDYFIIIRENERNIYQKKEYSFVELSSGKEYRKLWGGTKVRKVVY